MPEIISRKEARALGLKRYFTGKPCKQGHVCEHRINRDCIECDKLRSKRRYQKNRQTERRKNREYYTLNKAAAIGRATRWAAENPEKKKIHQKKYEKKNREKLREGQKRWTLRVRHTRKLKAMKRKHFYIWYYNGPKNPKDEKQWLRKNRALLRSVKRYLRSPPREQSESSQPET